MKKAISLFLMISALLHAEEQIAEIPNTLMLEEENLQRNYFSYFSLGMCGFVLPVSPEISFGWRKLNTRHAWDVQGGSSVVVGQYFWGQLSYLHFFLPTTGSYSAPYLGVGLTVGHSAFQHSSKLRLKVYGNIPFTIGYQWGKERANQFFQIQFTPIFITTFSYGVGF